MVIIPPLFALYCFETLNPWKTSNRKLHNENTIKPRQWYNSQSLKYPYGCHNTLVCSLFFWNLPWARRYIYLQVILFFFSQLNGLTSFFFANSVCVHYYYKINKEYPWPRWKSISSRSYILILPSKLIITITSLKDNVDKLTRCS